MQKRLKLCYNELEQYNLALERKPAHHIWKRDFDQLEQAGQTLQIQIQHRMQAANMQLEHAAALTASLSPYRVLARGYAMITTGRGQILPADQLEPDKTIYIRSRRVSAHTASPVCSWVRPQAAACHRLHSKSPSARQMHRCCICRRESILPIKKQTLLLEMISRGWVCKR